MRTLLPAILLATFTSASSAQVADRALGNSGELYGVAAGSIGELFSDRKDLAADTAVLALEVTQAGGEARRLLVPGTEDTRTESLLQLLYEPRSDSLILLWQSVSAAGELRLDFATRGDAWSQTFSVSEDGAAIEFPSTPLLAVTRDTFDLELEGDVTAPTSRSVVHLAWRDDQGVARYLPLIFVDGSYLGPQRSVPLSTTFFPSREDDGSEIAALAPGLDQALSLQVADPNRSVMLSFANPDSRRLGSVEIGLAPLELEALGDLIRNRILDQADVYDPDNPTALADKMRMEIIFIGHRYTSLHPGVVDFVAEELASWISDSGSSYGSGELEDLSNAARRLAIDLAGSVSVSLVEDPADPDRQIPDIQLGRFLDALETVSALEGLLTVRVVADRPAPAIGPGVAAIFTSRDGGDLLVGWKPDDANQVFYVESRAHLEDGAWSERHTLKLGPGLSLQDAVELLERKIR